MKQINKLPTSGDITIETDEYQIELLALGILPNITTIAYIQIDGDTKAKIDMEIEHAEPVKDIFIGTLVQEQKIMYDNDISEVSGKMFSDFTLHALGKSWALSGKITGRINVKFLAIFSTQHKYVKYSFLKPNPILN